MSLLIDVQSRVVLKFWNIIYALLNCEQLMSEISLYLSANFSILERSNIKSYKLENYIKSVW